MPAECCVERWERLLREDPEMPVFLLIGKDELAVETVEFWLSRAREEGVNLAKIRKVEAHRDALIDYSVARPERMQLPD